MAKKRKPICECACCKNNFKFDFSDHLLEEIGKGNCVIFAGSGVSTENANAFSHSLYSEIQHKLSEKDGLSFSQLMEKFCAQPDGRLKLVRLIQDRFDYINSFADLRREATKFHRELATMPYLTKIVTTNWDTYFEDYAGSKPFVYSPDLAFWDEPQRSVLKIHGSIDNYSSIVATSSDYDRCLQDLSKNLIGSKLKELLATKTCVFVGYSLMDEDFQQIFSFAQTELGNFSRTHYVVTPMDVDLAIVPFGNRLVHVRTDGTYFLENVKEHMCNTRCFAPDSVYDYATDSFDAIIDRREYVIDNFSLTSSPAILACKAYQDGLRHCYLRIMDCRNDGKYSCLHTLQDMVYSYQNKYDDYLRAGDFFNAAYFYGYMNGLISILVFNKSRDFRFVPPFFYFGVDEFGSQKKLKEIMKEPEKHNKKAARYFQKMVQKNNIPDDFVVNHTPFG